MPDQWATLPAPVRAALAQLPAQYRVPIEAGLAGLAPFMALNAAESDAAIAAAHDARETTDRSRGSAEALEEHLRSLLAREQERWDRAVDMVLSTGVPSSADLDALADVLRVDGFVATAATFDDFMLDDEAPLRLGPSPGSAPRRGPELQSIARAVDPRDFPDVGPHLAAITAPGQLVTSDAGRWVRFNEGYALALGDGTGMDAVDGIAAQVTLAADTSTEPFELELARLASGRPPALQRHAVAALASSLGAREATIPIEPDALPAWLAFGAAIPLTAPPATRLGEVVSLLRDLKTVDNADRGAAVLLSLTWEWARIRPYLSPRPQTPESPVIQVGQVRWCTLTDRPLFWLPVFPDHPDTIGGRDRPWTTDIPSAAARWEVTPPALRLDPEWAAALIVVPGTSQVLAIDPAGNGWDLDSDYESIVLARRHHREPWLNALEIVHRDVPTTVIASLAQAAETREPPSPVAAEEATARDRS